MVYAISILVTALFIILHIVTNKKCREQASERYVDVKFKQKCCEYISAFSLPDECCVTNESKWKNQIKLIRMRIKLKKQGKLFDVFMQDDELVKSMLKFDLTSLSKLPSVAIDKLDVKEPRVVKIARFCLSHSDYKFFDERFLQLVNAQNKTYTLTFAEISMLKEAFLYVLIEKLYFLHQNINTLMKTFDLAKKYCKFPDMHIFDKRYNSYIKSKLFLAQCAIIVNFDNDGYTKAFSDVLDEMYRQYTNVLNAWQCILKTDFSSYYSPLEIYDKFEVFANANEVCKQNFLMSASMVSDKENIDEFIFAIRVEKYMSTASSGHIKVHRLKMPSSKIVCLFSQKQDISMLAVALSSQYFMNLLFNNSVKSRKMSSSISKTLDFENSFEPIYKFQTLNFGISTIGGKLKVSPHLPKQVVSADIVFVENETKNNLKIERGEENALYVGNTKMSGVSQIKLSKKPLDIKVVVKTTNDQ